MKFLTSTLVVLFALKLLKNAIFNVPNFIFAFEFLYMKLIQLKKRPLIPNSFSLYSNASRLTVSKAL